MTAGFAHTDIELALAALVMTVLTLLAYRAGCRYRLKSPQLENAVLVGAIGLAFLLGWSFFGRLVWAEAIQASSVLYWSNLTPIALGFVGGLAGHTRSLRRGLRPVVVTLFWVLAIGFVATPIARPVFFPLSLETPAQWKNGVCMQSHEASCAPAAAVTLLKLNGITTSESELSSACLSSTLGTAPLGLYRGLKSFAGEHGLEAKVANTQPEDWVANGQLPNVALVKFDDLVGMPISNRFLGNRVSGHVITVLGRTDGGRWLIGDPAVGKISWSDEQLKARFTGEAIYLQANHSVE
ncbi:hypothetical protein SAMN06265222_101386 [Neorhodopirellula lusitana]|uniref:Peptidase C39 domain-containing protein n=1 Tax=Neorhodopirellula lusitana TaxID=445327 RepID=A0ABY1PPY6_9BACT|nr:peptidase C39 [Neorhodopirellula lusitana]SMP39969.1 hypothetical protein SAMN06265222_101386 [Neorhodopirellula lusitana]